MPRSIEHLAFCFDALEDILNFDVELVELYGDDDEVVCARGVSGMGRTMTAQD